MNPYVCIAGIIALVAVGLTCPWFDLSGQARPLLIICCILALVAVLILDLLAGMPLRVILDLFFIATFLLI